ncbi:MAG: DUF2851 family protein [Bacteroides sp.]|nr:DUF2851 family protein [Bacteroides sp.]MCM1095178.1 DUF2851 family protein [Terasakiella sp.]
MGPEALLQYMWQHRLWDPRRCLTTDGRRITVLDPGLANPHAGPDFFNAKLRIGPDLWAGNVEIHCRASDWHRHHHTDDPAYHTVVLHVVAESDCIITRPDGSVVAQMVMPHAPDFRERYSAMVDSDAMPACRDELASTPSIYITDWVTALGIERMHAKADRVMAWHAELDSDWRATAYIALARALGFGTNSDAFELLARITPLRHLLRHSDDPALLEAALMGQAGMLDRVDRHSLEPGPEQDYYERIVAHHRFLSAKYGWSASPRPAWRMARMRPPNQPRRRIALLAALLADGFPAGRRIYNLDSLDAARRLLDVPLPSYWREHHDYGCRTAAVRTALSASSVTTVIINAVVPLIYARSRAMGDEQAAARAVDMLTALPPEDNTIVRRFASAGIPVPDAFTSQALIQLHTGYCNTRKCLYCRLGHRYLTARAMPFPR